MTVRVERNHSTAKIPLSEVAQNLIKQNFEYLSNTTHANLSHKPLYLYRPHTNPYTYIVSSSSPTDSSKHRDVKIVHFQMKVRKGYY